MAKCVGRFLRLALEQAGVVRGVHTGLFSFSSDHSFV